MVSLINEAFPQMVVEMPLPQGFINQQNIHLIPPGFFIYFMQTPAFYLFCRKSSNIFEKNLRTRSSRIKWIFLHQKSPPF